MNAAARVAALEIDAHEVRAVLVRTGKKPAVVERAVAAIRVDDSCERAEAVAAAIREAAGGLKSRPSSFVLSAPMQWAVVRNLTLPFKGRARVVAAVPFELEPFLAVPIDELVIDSVTVSEQGGETQVLVVGVRQAPLAEQLAACDAAGIYVESIGLDAAGLTALWQRANRSPEPLQAVVHIREHGSYLAVIHHNRLTYLRVLPLTHADVIADPAAAGRALRTALRAFQASWQGDEGVAGLAVTGICLDDAGCEALQDAAGIPVSWVAAELLAAGAGAGPDVPDADSGAVEDRWTGAAGVAVAALGAAADRFEFRSGPLHADRPLPGLISHLVFSAALLLIVVGGFGAYSLMAYRGNVQATEALAQEIWQTYAEVFPEAAAEGRPSNDTGGARTFAMMEERMSKRAGDAGAFSPELFAKPPFIELLREVARILPDSQVTITEVQLLQGARNELRIRGIVKESGVFGELMTQLETSGLLDFNAATGVQRNFQEGSETFTITAGV